MAKGSDKEKGKPQASDDDKKQQQSTVTAKAKADAEQAAAEKAAAEAKSKAQADAAAKAKADADAKAEKAKSDTDRGDDKSKSVDSKSDDNGRKQSADDVKLKAQTQEKTKSGDHDTGDDDKQQQAAAAAAAAKAKSEADAKAKDGPEKTGDSHDGKGDGSCDKDDDKSKSEKADASKKADDDRDGGSRHVADGSKDGDKRASGEKDDDQSHHTKSHDDDSRPHEHGDKSEHSDHDGGSKPDGDSHNSGPTPVVTQPAVTPPNLTPPPAEALVLKAADASNVGASTTLLGTGTSDILKAASGHDDVFGRGGNDTIHGADSTMATLPIAIDGALENAADANAVSFLVSGMPTGATLSAGVDNGNGTWSLSKADLAGLSITADAGSDFTLHVSASATDGSGLQQNADLHVTMHAGQGNLLSGGSGSDTIYGSSNGDDMIYGGSVVHTGHSSGVADDDVIHVGNGNAHVWGQGGNDTIYAGAGRDSIWGGVGDDIVHVGTGSGDFHGGSGFDTLDFSNVANGVTVDLKAKTASGDLSVKGFEAVIGTAHDDSIWGDANANVLTGGAGNDTFGFHKSDLKLGAVDHITDFGAGDRLDLSAVLQGKSQGLVVTDSDMGTMIAAKIGNIMHDVVVLDGVHGLTAQDMLSHGMILT